MYFSFHKSYQSVILTILVVLLLLRFEGGGLLANYLRSGKREREERENEQIG